jgi:hypothetical protein
MRRLQLLLSKNDTAKTDNRINVLPYQRRQLLWGVLGAFAALLKWVGANNPQWVETYYSRGLFRFIRYGIDYSVALLPFATMYILIPVLLVWTVLTLRKWVKRSRNWSQRITDSLIAIVGVLGSVLFWFLVLWGYNYDRIPLERQLSISPRPLPLSEIQKELEEETALIIEYRRQIPGLTDSMTFSHAQLPAKLEKVLRSNLTFWLSSNGFPTPGRVRGRRMYPRGSFLRFSTAGLYFPFTGEGHIDPGLHPVQWPYVLTHELAHGYGFGDEGSCNFLAYVALVEEENPAIAYAGHLNYWRTLAIQYRRYEPDAYDQLRSNLPQGIQNDLNGINQAMQRYPDLVPGLQYQMYDAYLKTQGIKEGMLNYNRVIMLVRAWREALKT